MPPVFIYNANVQDKSKLKLRPGWVEGLPAAQGEYEFGDGMIHSVDSHVSVRKGGRTDKELFIATMLFYKSLYNETLAPRFFWDRDRLVKGSVMIKTYSGIGRQAKLAANIKFCEDMHVLGFYIVPGLPNLTQVSQKIDNLYETFKNMTNTTSQEVFTRKTYNRALAVKKQVEELAKGNFGVSTKPIEPAQLDNYNIPKIVDRKPGYDIKKRPWSYYFTLAKIFRS